MEKLKDIRKRQLSELEYITPEKLSDLIGLDVVEYITTLEYDVRHQKNTCWIFNTPSFFTNVGDTYVYYKCKSKN